MKANVLSVLAALLVAAIAYVLYGAISPGLPGRAGEVWTSPDGHTRIVERSIDDGGATVGFYRNLYVERERQSERITFFRLDPDARLVASCDWRGNTTCTITIDPQARNAWRESPAENGTFLGVRITFRRTP